MIDIKIYYLKKGQNSILKTIGLKDNICEIYNLSEKNKLRKIEKIVKKLKHNEINYVVISKEIHFMSNFVNAINSHQISIFDGKWISNYLILDMIEYLQKNKKLLNNDEVAILANDFTEEVKGNINQLVKKFKKVRIITNHADKFKKLENDLFEKDGISIIVSNNKKKSLLKVQLIINFDFVEEEINKYNINEETIIISIDDKIRIKKKRFSGIVITDYEVEFENLEQNNLIMKDFYKKEICEANIYKNLIGRMQLSEANCTKYEIVKNIINENKIKIDKLYSVNGTI